MAFDQTTRNRLQRFVNDARRVLEEEFTRQLQNDYGMDPNAGTVAELASLRHINDAQRETARILRDTLAHYTASGDMNATQGLDRIVREQAFTVLNRLAALRMAEARGLLIESVGNGFQAKGFQLYARLAGTGLGETGDAYRVYLFSVFDELAQDLPGLFDRYSPQGRLFPREAALLQVLNLINDADIAPLWSEDETIGWIYQYFNSKEERKAMRDASQAPRNSRELAVRNQFFTPRYVVEFLVDNTLGRLWFNATGGATGLRDRCQYLLVKPDETPQAATKLRDPRTLKLLDPACGSMHFGLYAFDLFAEIYREAWAWEQQHGPGSLDVSTQPRAALKPLSQTYEDEAAFLRDVPRLIIEHNIYGVDIDPRAAQIASLALWLRAQRAWHDAGVKAKDRPLIGNGHVVAAIAPPAERELRQQFAANLDSKDAELFEKTLQMLKGLPELGVLLQVERELPSLIRQVYVGKGTGLFAQQEQQNWQQAEARLREALTEFAQAAKSTYQGRLFAQDALQGLRLIDLCREVFDVVVMNPPFGEGTQEAKEYIEQNFPASRYDLGAVFLDRALRLLSNDGLVGILSNRTIYYLARLAKFRETLLESAEVRSFSDLGSDVLDAMVEAAAATFQKVKNVPSACVFIRATNAKLKDEFLLERIVNPDADNRFLVDARNFLDSEGFEFSYWLPKNILKIRTSNIGLDRYGVEVRQGIATGDNFRFLRLLWEIPPCHIYGDWHPYSKGGDYSPLVYDIHLVVAWGEKWQRFFNGNTTVFSCLVTKNAKQYLDRPGLTYPTRTSSRFGPRAMPAGSIFDTKGSAIFSDDVKIEGDTNDTLIGLAAILNSKFSQVLIDTYVGAAENSSRSYGEGVVSRLPIDLPGILDRLNVSSLRATLFSLTRLSQYRETSQYFVAPARLGEFDAIEDSWRSVSAERLKAKTQFHSLLAEVDSSIANHYSFDQSDLQFIQREIERYSEIEPACLSIPTLDAFSSHVVSYMVGCEFSRWNLDFAKNSKNWPNPPDPFARLTRLPPGALPSSIDGGKIKTTSDLALGISKVAHEIWGDRSQRIELELLSGLGANSFEAYLEQKFFDFHLGVYGQSRRQAPIYWPVGTTSGSYTLWIYYHSLTSQTLYTAINDFVEPKLKQVGADVTTLRNKGSARTRDDEKQFEALQAFELELIELRDTLLKLAPSYKPNHDDGVQISAAPLWPLFRHKPWQKVLKDTWAKLEKGDYDWAMLAMNYWPERVREKCKTDKSLAIAHGLEDLYVEPEVQPKKTRGRKKSGEV